jgi:ABC-type lipoprotein release transport system permease subunit
MLRSLTHYWRIHLAVLLGAAVATSVLTGALLVGDSVEESLRQLTLGRLGRVDQCVVASRYVRQHLADELSNNEAVTRTAPMIAVHASIQVASSGRRANKVLLFGVDERFGGFFEHLPTDSSRSSRLRILHPNGPLKRTLEIEEGDALILSIETHTDIHREFLFGEGGAEDRVIRRRVSAGATAEDEAGGRFSFEPNQSIPLVAFVQLRALQKFLKVDGRVNRILIESSQNELVRLDGFVDLEDYGLELKRSGETLILESDQFFLKELVAEAARHAADQYGVSADGVLTYLANRMSTDRGSVPYSMISAMGRLDETDDSVDSYVILNGHAAARLGAVKGDTVTIRYYELERDEGFVETEIRLPMREPVAINGVAADRTLTPEFPGVRDANNMADWDAPFPVDLGAITTLDEDYWDEHGATPKAFLPLALGQRIWKNRFGNLTSVRFVSDVSRDDIVRGLLERLSPENQGIRVLALRANGLEAARGTADFRGLFFGFSTFLLVASLTMVSQLFKLGVEDRRSEIGLMKAVGFKTGSVSRLLIIEGVTLAVLGGLAGFLGAAAYARLMIHGLSTWWIGAVGTSLLIYDGSTVSFLIGWLLSVLLVGLVVWRAVGRESRGVIVDLLRHRGSDVERPMSTRIRMLARVSGMLAVLLAGGSIIMKPADRIVLFFGVGTLALTALLAAVRVLATRSGEPGRSTFALAQTQLLRFPGRTMASVTLVSLAVFVLVTVALNRNEDSGSRIPAGAGGFRWIGESTIQIGEDLGDRKVLMDFGFSPSQLGQMGPVEVHRYRLRPGEDVSCLNLHRPGQPRILGVPERTVDRGGFEFQAVAEGVDVQNPWRGLETPLEDGAIPAIGDFNSVQWILHSGLGQDIVIQDEQGKPVKLRFVALLKGSVLQSEVMIGEKPFTELFPSVYGYSFFALNTMGAQDKAGSWWEKNLSAYGMDVVTSQFRLARYRAVENTYMATFQMIGGLGALLGMLGIAVMMVRNAAERRGELAGMRAIGFSKRNLQMMLLYETSLLVVLGVLIGTVSGVFAVLPTILERAGSIPLQEVLFLLVAVAVAGILFGRLAASAALRAPIIQTLKVEH